jgi:hypothetical protein
MKKVIFLATISLVSILFSNCASSGYSLPQGSIFTGVTLNKDVSTAADLNTKSGESCAFSVLNLFAFGDAGAKAAATRGGLKVVRAVDFSYTDVFYGALFSSVCTIVRGE